MPKVHDPGALARVLPGVWQVGASNLPVWLDGERVSPRVEFGLTSQDPFVLREVAHFTTPEGRVRQVARVNRWRRDAFRSRGTGWRVLQTQSWSVIGVDDTGTIAVFRFRQSRIAQGGIVVLTRSGAGLLELRSVVASKSDEFGLTPEEFGSLTWFEPATDEGRLRSG